MEPGAHTTYAAWRLCPEASAPEKALSLRVTLLANNRDHHGTTPVGGFDPEHSRSMASSLVVTDARLFSLTIRAPGGNIVAEA